MHDITQLRGMCSIGKEEEEEEEEKNKIDFTQIF